MARTRRGRSTERGSAAIAKRLARLRKDKGITQGEMAKLIGVSQPVVCDYEHGNLRLHGELLIVLANILRVSVDEILGLEPMPPSKPVKDRRLQRRLEQIDRLPKRDREALLRTIDAFLMKGGYPN